MLKYPHALAPVVITGASTGLGQAAALQLAAVGHPVVIIAREGQKARDAQAAIIHQTGNPNVTLETADLSSQADIYAVAEAINTRHPEIAIFISNAGAHFKERCLSVDGIEMTLAINHFAPFMLANLLMAPLKAHGAARIVIIASSLQLPIDLHDLNRDAAYEGLKVYGETKFANIQFTLELARRFANTGVTANCLAPGLVRTELLRRSTGLVRFLSRTVGPLFMDKPENAAKRIVRLALDPALQGVTGQYFAKDKHARAIDQVYDLASVQRLWWKSEQLTGIRYATPLIDLSHAAQ